jgi:hypothetical protein
MNFKVMKMLRQQISVLLQCCTTTVTHNSLDSGYALKIFRKDMHEQLMAITHEKGPTKKKSFPDTDYG